MKGKVLFFNILKGFGKVLTEEDTPQEVFIHFTEIQNNANILLENEEIEFEVENSAKGLSAKNLNRIIDREIGIIEQFENGFGFIRSSSSTDEKFFVHHSDVIGGGFKKIESGFEVEFTPDVSDKGLQAKKIVLRDIQELHWKNSLTFKIGIPRLQI